ncbi:MAG: prepilin-type N-terminal cleavage/methylation domain-containing protein [Planctomycetes bacterium]|nr:prepilin-type N-terminal cleavage/methylation domain-containing protein [Planctomycetota bacterium]
MLPAITMRTNAPRFAEKHVLRRGLTLVELVLVLALLVVISAISVPLLEGSFSRAALHSGGDLLRGAWATARLAAMQSGATHVFRFEPNGSRFQIVALNALGAPEASDLAPIDPEAEPPATEFVRLSENRLPDGIIFTGGNISSSAQVLATLPSAAEGPWSQPILFHPNGTTSDASVLLANSRQAMIRVTLRGLTGISQTAEVESEAAP